MEGIQRNRAKTTQRIVEALENVIAERGIEGIRVSRIAEEADVSKVLIYRYFGSLDGLMDYYVKMGKLFPTFTPMVLNQIRPLYGSDLSQVWYRQVIQTYRFFRTFKAAREILKATVIENDETAAATSRAVDEEMTRLVEQLSFAQGVDAKAISAVMLGAMSYLTLMAQNSRTMIDLNLRSEGDWTRIEDAVKLICTALSGQLAATGEVTMNAQMASTLVSSW